MYEGHAFIRQGRYRTITQQLTTTLFGQNLAQGNRNERFKIALLRFAYTHSPKSSSFKVWAVSKKTLQMNSSH